MAVCYIPLVKRGDAFAIKAVKRGKGYESDKKSLAVEWEVIENPGFWSGNGGGFWGRESSSGSGVDQIGLLRGKPPHDISIGGVLRRAK